MDDYPKVSICIPTYNRCGYLKQTIESALAQDYPNLEVIVSDNASTDDTENIVKLFSNDRRFRFHRNNINVGMVGNWRTLLYELVNGDWFVILSDDDYFIDNNYVSKAIGLSRSSKVKFIYSNGYILHTKNNMMEELIIPYETVENGINIFLKTAKAKPQEFTLCNILFETSQAKALNAFSNLNNLYCDSQLFLEMCLLGNVGVIKDFVSVYRYHEGNLVTKERTYDELLAISEVYFSPYKLLLKLGALDHNKIRAWENKVLRPAIKSIILKISALHGDKFRSAMTILNAKSTYNLFWYYIDPVFLLKFICTKQERLYKLLKLLKTRYGIIKE